MRWQYRDPALVWLFVPAYVAHLAEEYFGGFPEWFAWIAGRPLPVDAFLVINAVALIVMVAAVRMATRREERGWMAIAIATVLLVNGLAHLAASIFTGTYSPGLITGVVLYLPLGQLALIRAWHQAPPRMLLQGVLAGLAAHAVVTATAVASSLPAPSSQLPASSFQLPAPSSQFPAPSSQLPAPSSQLLTPDS